MSLAALACALAASTAAPSQEAADLQAIRREGLQHSQVMRYERELTDRLGERLTGSPAFDRAAAWAVAQLRAAGATDARKEDWGEFGQAWTPLGADVSAAEPYAMTLQAQATPWSPGTPGAVEGDAVLVPLLRDEAALAAWRGRLRGKVVLYGAPPVVDPDRTPSMVIQDAAALRRFVDPSVKDRDRTEENRAYYRAANFDEIVARAFAQEGVLAVLRPAGDGGALRVDETAMMGWRAYLPAHRQAVPSAAVATEPYDRVARLLSSGATVRLRVDLRVRTGSDHAHGANVLAELPGTEPDGEVVMFGGHLDSWTAGTGASDDGAGAVVAMEALRILEAAGVRPRRTIRVALWGGEEQGVLGSLRYAQAHLGTVEMPSRDAADATPYAFATPVRVQPGPGAARIAAYFNMDKGSGRLLGVAVRGNPAAARAAAGWVSAVADLGFTAVSLKAETQVDSDSFARLGVPVLDFH